MSQTKISEAVEPSAGESVAPETVSKATYDKLYDDYQKLVAAFNRLLKAHNELFIEHLFNEDK